MRNGIRLVIRLLPWAVALPWCAKLAECLYGLARVPDLTRAEYDRSPVGEPAVAVIVPARNEGAGIRACLESLAAQDYPALRVLAVDDRSRDETGAVIDELAAAHPARVEAIHIEELPPGWLGKTHAMAVAAHRAIAAGAEFLLFTDGDVVFGAGIVRRSVTEAQAASADHMITLPTTVTHSPGESMVLACLHVLGLFAIRPWKVADPRAKDAVGVGAFNLIRTRAYRDLGGFDAMPMEILEDLTLGRRVKLAGLRQRIAYAPGEVAVHWAPGVVGVLHGMTKNMFAVFRFRPGLLLGGACALAVFWIGPFALLFVPGARFPGALALSAMAGMYTLASPRMRLSPLWFLAAPAAAGLLIYSMLRSMAITLRHGGVTWRGTFYSLDALRTAIAAQASAHPGLGPALWDQDPTC